MPRKTPGRDTISTTYTTNEYEAIKKLAAKKHTSMAEITRQFVVQGLNGEVTQNNIDVLAPIIREQLSIILNPQIERLAALSAKACIQSGAAAYLTAEVLSSFMPPELRQDFNEAYTKARKKSVEYMRKKSYEE